MKHTVLLGLNSFWKDFDKIYNLCLQKILYLCINLAYVISLFSFIVDYDLIILVETKI